jgi:hypothetical protein
LLDTHAFAQQTPENNDNEGAEQQSDCFDLASWLSLAESRCQEQSARYVGSGDPENGQLQVPGAGNLTWQDLRKVDPVKTSRIGSVVRDGSPDQYLTQKEQSHKYKVFEGCPLRFRGRPRNELGVNVSCPALPSEEIKSAKDKQRQGESSEQRNQTERAPKDCITARHIPDCRVVRTLDSSNS